MSNLDEQTKARIRAEEEYCAKVRGELGQVAQTPSAPAKEHWGAWDYIKLAFIPVLLLLVLGVWRQAIYKVNPELGYEDARRAGWEEGETLEINGPKRKSTVTEEPKFWEGGGELNTDPVQLEAQDYEVEVTTGGDCFYSFALRGVDNNVAEYLARSEMDTQHSNIYGLLAGTYYLNVTTGPAPNCPWSVTLTPR